jgi:hypothetical protein
MNKNKKKMAIIVIVSIVCLMVFLYFMKNNIVKLFGYSHERPKWVSPYKYYGNKYNPPSRKLELLKRLEEEDQLEAKQKLQRAFQNTNIDDVNKDLDR